MPKLSIITVNFNNAEGLKRTIDSVVAQNYSDLEFIVVDGNSTDTSVAILEENNSHITKWISEPDNGVYQAMNKGVGMAGGEYMLFLNSGDHLYHPSVLLKINSYLKKNDLLLFDIQVKGQGKDFIKMHPDIIRFSFLFEDTFAHQSVCIKRKLFDTIGTYDESLQIVSDWKFFVRALVHGCSYKTIHEVLTTYYLDGMSATAKGTFKRREEREEVLKNDFSLFYNDYKRLKTLDLNRFKILNELEKSKPAQKINSLVLRVLLRIFRNRSLKDL